VKRFQRSANGYFASPDDDATIRRSSPFINFHLNNIVVVVVVVITIAWRANQV
jgi:hypothetical protein